MNESATVGYRTRVVDAIREKFPDLREVDWYDGLFDEDDVREWGRGAPCAYVGILNVPSEHHGTGELNGDVSVVVVVLTQDEGLAREHDAQNWHFIESIADFANLNKFEDPNAGAATRVSFKRLRHPQLRREGVGLGIVEWQAGLTFGTNTAIERDQLRDPDGVIVPMPDRVSAEMEMFLGAPAREIENFDFHEEPL